MENEKPSYYAIITADVRYDEQLTDKAKLLYGEITCLCNKEGYCFATNNYFAKLYHCTTRAIQNSLAKLQERGYIKIIVENNFQRKIYISSGASSEKISLPKNEGYEKNFAGGYEKNFAGGYENNFIHNNINNNNINNNRLIDYNKFTLQKIFEDKGIFLNDEVKKIMPDSAIKNFEFFQEVITEIYNEPTYKKYINDFSYDDIVNAFEKYNKYKARVKKPTSYMARCITDVCRKRKTATA